MTIDNNSKEEEEEQQGKQITPSKEGGGGTNRLLPSTIEKRKVLIVDDEPDITLTLRIGLEDNGFEVYTFNDPMEALSNFKAGYYDLLLLDVKMPKMNGFELYTEIKKRDNDVKVCFMTAFEIYYDEFRRLFPKLSLSCFANKPVSIDTLSKLLYEELKTTAT
jgi:two-component system, OmpR family, response regulator ChvI